MTRDRRGFALLAVLLVLALLGAVITELALSMRLEAAAARAYKEGILAAHLAEAGVEQAIREILSESAVQGVDEDGVLVFYQLAPGQTVARPLPPLPRSGVPLGPGDFSYRITDEESRLNINLAPADQLDRLLGALGLDRRDQDIVRDSLLDWKDADDQYRVSGAESEDTYLKLPVPYRARNDYLQDVAELLQIRGVTPDLYLGTAERPGLRDLVTVRGRNAVNINTAPALVLEALGLSSAEVSDILQTRVGGAYPSVPGRFAGRRLAVGSQTFRIEAQGRIAGQPRARIVAIVRRGGAQPAQALPGAVPVDPVTVLSWRAGLEH